MWSFHIFKITFCIRGQLYLICYARTHPKIAAFSKAHHFSVSHLSRITEGSRQGWVGGGFSSQMTLFTWRQVGLLHTPPILRLSYHIFYWIPYQGILGLYVQPFLCKGGGERLMLTKVTFDEDIWDCMTMLDLEAHRFYAKLQSSLAGIWDATRICLHRKD